jgi:hypothetical protein
MPADVSADVRRLAQEMLELARSNDMGLIAAESCTAGLLGQALADAPGAAQFFHGTFVTTPRNRKRLASGYRLICCEPKAPSAVKSQLRWRKARLSDPMPLWA